jgi:hypothetical protein
MLDRCDRALPNDYARLRWQTTLGVTFGLQRIFAALANLASSELRAAGHTGRGDPLAGLEKHIRSDQPVRPSFCRPCSRARTRANASKSVSAFDIKTPILRIRSACCARAASGHAVAAPARRLMKPRRTAATKQDQALSLANHPNCAH